MTLWYPERLTGDYRVSYEATVLMQEGPCDRLGDLNCFWAAEDPEHGDDFFAGRRGGADFRTLQLPGPVLRGLRGQREYDDTVSGATYGNRYGAPADEVKPLIGEYTDAGHLLVANRPIRIEITVDSGRTTSGSTARNSFSRKLSPGEGDGYFGLRLLNNRTRIVNFRIETR